MFKNMNDIELKQAYEEFIQHNNTGVLQDGIIRNISKQLGDHNLTIFNTEMNLLKEIADRWYQIK